MYLQSLEIIGFKSFAARTILQFNRGVTAVVGPNGCGKSNVLDSLRWVLGEQSAKALRGGEMADVIFSGTDSRPALGMAEVSLTFSDCEKELGVEWNEVRITRRVYRDGKGEYFLNKTPCRLKDIHQLFMDTGIGRSAYSIMEQGKISQILSSRPEDRRAIFEEAAGITKFKSQKKEALRKLEHTESNLLRVTDIVKEVRRQIGSLQRQAGKARRYQSLLSDLRTFDTHLSHRNFQALSNEKQAVEGQLTRVEKERSGAEDASQEEEVYLLDLRGRLGALEEAMSAARDGVQTLRNRLFSAESRIATNAERVTELRERVVRSTDEVAAAERKIHEQESELEQTDRMLSDLLEVLRSGESELSASHQRMESVRRERGGAENTLRLVNGEISRLENELNGLQSQISSASGRREAGLARLDLVRGELATADGVAGQSLERVAEAEQLVERTAAAVVAMRTALDDWQMQHDAAQKARQAADTELNARTRRLTEVESRLAVLVQLQSEGEGLGEGAQAVLKGLDRPELFKPALHGAVAAAIDAAPEWIPAIEAALGSHLQTVIFKDAAVAESAAITLASRKLGRAAIAPTEWLAEPASADRPALPEGATAWALDMVRCAPFASSLVHALLENVAIVPDFETAFKLKALHPDLGFVTTDGGLIARSGVVSAGATGDAGSSVILRRAQIAKLESELQDARAEHEAAVAARNAAVEALEAGQQRLREARDEVQRTEVAAATARTEREGHRRQAAQAQDRRNTLDRERIQLEQQLQESLQRVDSLERRMAELTAQRDAKRGALADTQSELERLREREREATDANNELRLRVATEKQRRENLSRQRTPIAARVTELTQAIAQSRNDILSHEQRITSLETEAETLAQSMGGWRDEMVEAEAEVSRVTAERTAATDDIATREAHLREVRRQIADLQEERSRAEVRGTQLDLRMESIREHIQRRYQLEIADFAPDSYALVCALRDRKEKAAAQAEPAGEDAPAMPQEPVSEPIPAEEPQFVEEIPWGRIEALVKELTEKLDGMGPVNMDAIQEYEELEQRLQFLEQQNTDLTNAKAELLEVIARINKTTKVLFAETFEKVRVNFQEMFTELFGGGKANLLLADESDPLESGIEIIAKPPGKQLQSISLLSGGEMTMTAVALLFAIYMVKPSPFCVLDEMDAPLDESNINRFIKILDRFVGQSQFIVITHNKRTIGRADMLYGVTMEEHGVSKLVSVKFRHRETDDNLAAIPSVAETFGKRGDLHSETLAN